MTIYNINDVNYFEEKINEMKQGCGLDDYIDFNIEKENEKFNLSSSALNALKKLDDKMFLKTFKKNIYTSKFDEMYYIYKILFIFLGEKDLENTINKEIFWEKCDNYFSEKENLGQFIINKCKNLDFSLKNLYKLDEYSAGIKKNLAPTYYSKICGFTGLFIFLIRDALNYMGIFLDENNKSCNSYNYSNEKKNEGQYNITIRNLEHNNNVLKTLHNFIEYLCK